MLSNDNRFRSGWLSFLHRVGPGAKDFRSKGGVLGSGSMQVAFSIQANIFNIDVDRYSPYDGVLSFMGHAFIEVLPKWMPPSVDPVFIGR